MFQWELLFQTWHGPLTKKEVFLPTALSFEVILLVDFLGEEIIVFFKPIQTNSAIHSSAQHPQKETKYDGPVPVIVEALGSRASSTESF